MSRTTSRQMRKSKWKQRDKLYREQQRERAKSRRVKRQARALINLLAVGGVSW